MDKIISKLNITQNVTLITLANIPINNKSIAKIFTSLAEADINVDMISQTSPLKGKINICFTLQDDVLFNAIQTLGTYKKHIPSLRIDVNSNNTKLSLYDENMKYQPGIAAKTMVILSEADVDIKMITTSEIDISYLIYASDEKKAIQSLKNIIKD
ncbi:ACT domain-containing protein [Vallitalea sp.]|jgi:aspartokinase|uniref:ACT domain-containing protein n=1 Tax=Vallitalea sp. TaxID=1882829 RepID=UPI0025D21AC9|nr:ACT domain-containing protein [Vallitalea sp.]MCT4688695.1 ACT domain-containing protein [Vallitalea sp.]